MPGNILLRQWAALGNRDGESMRWGKVVLVRQKLLADVDNFKKHAERFLQTLPNYQKLERQ